jgi:uncharacterized membrane protein
MKQKAKGSLIGAVGSILIGSAILLFVATIVLNSLKDAARPGPCGAGQTANRAEWNETNSTVDQLKTFLTISSILLGVLGITMIGAAIIGYIGGAFGGKE